ncbi:MAG TPA: cysteine synthase family protein [Bryobacteraceae bacterium]|nr:cysteine synthase family protein [Bryobacteraceae bacterium]
MSTLQARFESPPHADMHPPQAASSILNAIGNTPLIQLHKVVPPNGARVFLKLEYFNPTGSYKDRMALAVVEGAEKRGALKPGMRVVEYTGGSTGSSLAMVCAVKGYGFVPISSDAFAREKLETMRVFGGDLKVLPSDGRGITPELMARMKEALQHEAAEPGSFWADQFHNDDVLEGYRPLGEEVLRQLDSPIDVFCAAVGTAGMLGGASRALRAAQPKPRIVALEPASSPFLTTGKGGAHRVEGIGAGFWPSHLTPETYDEIRAIDEAAARQMARRLAREEGVLAGASTGLNVVAATQLASELGSGATIVTVAVDTGLKYLAGDLYTG